MTITATPSKRTTKRTPTPIVDPLARLTDETTDAYVERMRSITDDTALAASSAAAAAIDADDTGHAAAAIIDLVYRAKRAGDQAVHHATIVRNGVAPESYAHVTDALGMTDKNGVKFTGRAYSTLRESYRMHVAYSADAVTEWVAVWSEVEGSAPRNVRDALVWLERIGTDEEWTENTVDHYREQKRKRDEASTTAAATAADGRKRTKDLVTLGYVPGLEDVLPATRIAVMTDAQMDDAVKLFTVKLLKRRADAKRAAETAITEAIAREAAAAAAAATGDAEISA